MEAVEASLRKTRIGPMIEEHLDRIRNWKPENCDNDSILREGVIYTYDGSNIRIDLKNRKTFQLIKVEYAGKKKIATMLSDGDNQIRCEFFPQSHEPLYSKRLTQKEEFKFIQLHTFSVVISIDDLPLILTANDFKLVGDVGAITKRPRYSTPVECRPQIDLMINYIKRNLPSLNNFSDDEGLQFVSQPSSTHKVVRQKNLKSEDLGHSGSDTDGVNLSQDFTTQVPFDRRPLVDPRAAQTRKAATSLMMLLGQQKNKKTSPSASSDPLRNAKGAHAHPSATSTTTSSPNRSSGLSSDPRKNLTSTFREMKTETRPMSRQGPDERTLDERRDNLAADGVGRPTERRSEDVIPTQMQGKSMQHANSDNTLQARKAAKKTTLNYLPRRDFIIPEDQDALIEADEAWFPPWPGNRVPAARVPIQLLGQFNEAAHRRAGVGSGSGADLATSHSESEAVASPTGSEDHPSDLELEQPKSKSNKIPRATEELVEGDDSDTTSVLSWAPTPSQRIRKAELPPDSSIGEPSPSIPTMKNGTRMVTDERRSSDADEPNETLVSFGSQKSIIIDLEDEESELEESVPVALSQSNEPKTSENVVASKRFIESESVLIQKTTLGSGRTTVPSEPGNLPALLLEDRNAQNTVPSATSPSMASRGYDHPLIANPVQNILAFSEAKHGPLLPESGQIRHENGDDKSELPTLAGAKGCRPRKTNPNRTTYDVSPTFKHKLHESFVYPAPQTQVSQESPLPQQPSRDIGAVHSTVDISSEDGDAGAKDKLETAISSIIDETDDVEEADSMSENEINEIAVSKGHRSSRPASASPPQSDEFEEMLQTQLQSEMNGYSPQSPEPGPLRSQTWTTLDEATSRPTLNTSIQVSTSSPRSLASVQEAPDELYANMERATDYCIQQESHKALCFKAKLDSGGNAEFKELDSSNDQKVLGHSPTELDSVARNGRDSAEEIARNVVPGASDEPSFLSNSTSSSPRPALGPDAISLDHLEVLAQSALKVPSTRSIGREVSNSASNATAPRNYVEVIYDHFKAEYALHYDAEVNHFLALCKKIKVLREKRTLAPHQSIWDDFIIRHRLEYRQYMSDCADIAEDPEPYEVFYHKIIPRADFTKGIVTPPVLIQLLGMEPESSSLTPLSLSRSVSHGLPALQPPLSNSTRGSSLSHVLHVHEDRSILVTGKPSGLNSTKQRSPLSPVDLNAHAFEESPRPAPQNRAPKSEGILQGVDEVQVDEDNDAYTRKAKSEESHGVINSVNSSIRGGLGRFVARHSSMPASKEIKEHVVPIPETQSKEQIDLTQSSTPPTQRAERTASPSTTVNMWLSTSASPNRSTFPAKPTSRATSLARDRPGTISPPPPRDPSKRRSLPWASQSAQSKETPLRHSLHTKQRYSNPPVFLTRTSQAPASVPESTKEYKRKRDIMTSVETEEAPRLKSPKPNPDASKENTWYKDPNTPYQLYVRGYSSLKSERERANLGRKSAAKLMTGGVNVLGWMKGS